MQLALIESEDSLEETEAAVRKLALLAAQFVQQSVAGTPVPAC